MNKPRSAPRRAVSGILLLDKPLGITSNDALQKARRLYNAAKAGHTGTLDPLATGLLPLCFGEATKFAGELLDADKTYLATVQLGVTTDSADAAGQVLETREVAVSEKGFAALRPHYDERAIVELTVLIGTYNMHNRVMQALAIDPEPRG